MIETPLAAGRAWSDRRRRAEQLLAGDSPVADQLMLYVALCDAWSETAAEVSAAPPRPGDLVAYVIDSVMPRVVARTLVAGPEALREAVVSTFHEGDRGAMVTAWLAGDDQSPVDRYLARASTMAVLELVPELARTSSWDPADQRHCPACGGLPQLACFGLSDEALVTAQRVLVCSRCAASWTYPRMVCAGCGNDEGSKLPIFADHDRFPSLRIDACEVCRGYLVTVDRPKDPAAVPPVDEMLALPLDLYAREQGYRKLTPNLMGF